MRRPDTSMIARLVVYPLLAAALAGAMCIRQDPTGTAGDWGRTLTIDSWDMEVPAGVERGDEAVRVLASIEPLIPLHSPLGPPQPGDWLARPGINEPGQTFAQYLVCRPQLPRGAKRVIYIQPLGEFSPGQRRIVDKTAEFMSIYFSLPVKVLPDIPLDVIPGRARRVHPSWGDSQILTGYVLDKLLEPNRKPDAAATIAFTSSDLWPGEGWNFVFGMASLVERVGVWSIYRNGEADGTEEDFRLCLLRTIKTATHETGHMFSMLHCIAWECNMCGSNNRGESDRRTIALCPECLAKTAWATSADLKERFRRLEEFMRREGLTKEADFYRRSLEALTGH